MRDISLKNPKTSEQINYHGRLQPQLTSIYKYSRVSHIINSPIIIYSHIALSPKIMEVENGSILKVTVTAIGDTPIFTSMIKENGKPQTTQ